MIWGLLLVLSVPLSWGGEACERLRELPAAQLRALGPIVGVGASVTANFGQVISPAQRLASYLSLPYQMHAAPGAGSHASGARLSAGAGECGTLIGVDTFFWDTAGGCSSGAPAAFMRQVRARGCRQVILSTVPRRLPFGQSTSCVQRMNQQITALASPTVHIFGVVDALAARSQPRSYFSSDGLHLSEAGAEAAMEELCALLAPLEPALGVMHNDDARHNDELEALGTTFSLPVTSSER